MPVAIATQGLTKVFRTVRAVDELSLTIPRGVVFGFLGPNGAGKTTTIHLLLGLLRPTRGSATVLGHDTVTAADAIRNRATALLEHHGLYERLTAHDNLEFFGRIYRIPTAERARRIHDVLDELGLWERRRDPVATWSRGMKQKLAIARTLLPHRELVFLDEPTSGHDPAAAVELRELLLRLARRDGLTVFLTTHNLAEAEKVCDRVGLIRGGRLVAEGPVERLRARAAGNRIEIHGRRFTPALAERIRRRPEVAACVLDDGRLTVEFSKPAKAAPLVRLAVESGADVEEVRKAHPTLEDAYLAMMREGS